MAKIRIYYSSDFHIVLPEKFVELNEGSYLLTSVDLPTLELRGFQFDGWYLESSFTTQAVVGTSITEDTCLYAKWIETEVSMTTGIGERQFRMIRGLSDETMTVDNPNTLEPYTLSTLDITTKNGLSARQLISTVDDKIAAVADYINVHDVGY